MNSEQKSEPRGFEREVYVDTGKVELEGVLNILKDAAGIVLFAHGSGSSRHSLRNRFVAEMLQSQDVATLLFDLLTREEEFFDARTGQLRFDIPLLAKRLAGATRWVQRRPETQALSVGYFGASTGAAAALVAAAQLPDLISAVVSRGGRPDLAGQALDVVRAPTLLIVGGEDAPVITLNRQAFSHLHCSPKKLVLIPGASHLFEAPGTLEQAAKYAAEWFAHHLAPVAQLQA
jgi:putative phosphoribosyl transferase